MQPHTELTISAFAYIAQLSANERFAYLLKEIGLKPDQIDLIRNLSLAEVSELALNLGAQVLSIRVDADAMDSALVIMRRRQIDKAITERLMKAGASYPIMQELTGMNTREYNSYRELLQLHELVGRAKNLPEDTQRQVFEAWFGAEHIPDVRHRLLHVHDRTGAPLRAVWPLVCRWQRKAESRPSIKTDFAAAQS